MNKTCYNTRQWILINYLLKTAEEDPKKWVSQLDIRNQYPYSEIRPDGYIYNTDERIHDRCSMIWNDINHIQKIGEFRQVIIIKNNQYKLATKEEAILYINAQKEKAIKALQRASNVAKLVGLDGQATLFDCRNNDILKDSKAKNFLETVIHI